MSAPLPSRSESPLLQLAAAAKVNSYLRILGKRNDGFHELETIFQTLSIADTLSFYPLENPHSDDVLSCSDDTLPCDHNNLVWQAMTAWRAAGGKLPAIAIHLVKRLPAGGGLGGGSSDAAATLRGLQLLCAKLEGKLGDTATPKTQPVQAVSSEKLHQIACQLGSDVPFFLLGGRAHALGRGEQLTQLSDPPAAEPLTLLITNIHCSTPTVFSNLTADERKQSAPLPAPQRESAPANNELQAAALRAYPAMADAASWASQHGGMLCGSGGTWFAHGHVSGPHQHPEWQVVHCWTRPASELNLVL